MVAILQLKASKHFVYFVSIAVVTFTLLNIFPTREYYLMDNTNNTTTFNKTSYNSHLLHTYGRRTADIFQQCSKLIGKSSKSSCYISFLKCCRDFGLIPKRLRLKNPASSERSKAVIRRLNLYSSPPSSTVTGNFFIKTKLTRIYIAVISKNLKIKTNTKALQILEGMQHVIGPQLRCIP